MPTCTKCGRWDPSSANLVACSSCGGAFGPSETRWRAEAEAAAQGLTVDEYRLRRRLAEQVAEAEERAAQEAERAAFRAGTRSRLTAEGVPPKSADVWITAWEQQATRDGRWNVDAGYWDAGWAWIVAGRAQRAEPARWVHHPTGPEAGTHGQGLGFLWIIVAAPATIVLGVILLVAFLILGHSLWIPVISTAIGLIGGSLLMGFLDVGSWLVIDRLASRSTWVDRHGEVIWDLCGLYVAMAMLPITTIAAAILLLAVS